jgi:hypothetical protein
MHFCPACGSTEVVALADGWYACHAQRTQPAPLPAMAFGGPALPAAQLLEVGCGYQWRQLGGHGVV